MMDLEYVGSNPITATNLKQINMKITSAFFINMVIIFLFIMLAIISSILSLEVTGFFICCTIVFGMILPSCSLKH